MTLLALAWGVFGLAAPASSEPVTLPPSRPAPIPAGELPVDPAEHSVARLWNEAILHAIRHDSPRPSVHARNLYHLSGALWDAWAAFSASEEALLHEESAPKFDNLTDARRTAQSYAAYRLLSYRFESSPGHEESQALFDLVMASLGLDPGDTDTSGDSPAALGNRVGAAYIENGTGDGANEGSNYADATGYNPVNIPMLVWLPGSGGVSDINAWQPLVPPEAPAPQTFLTPHWHEVEPFALERPAPGDLYLDPGPQPRLGGVEEQTLREHVLQLIAFSATLDPGDGVTMNISPAVMGDNSLGANDGDGHERNPATDEPYADNIVLRGDWSRVLAEFWADGPNSSTPPGHWNEIANSVSDGLDSRRLGGTGPELSQLEWDTRLYLALNGALHDAAIAAWEVKYAYNSSRPITLIRAMAEQGQSSDSSAPGYHPDGLPLQDGLVEVITEASSSPGERHAHLAEHVGELALRGWRGHPDDPDSEIGGVGWILAVEWLPYQARHFVTPPFPGYISGHSTFSRAAAEVLAGLTGSAYFPGGLARYRVGPGEAFKLDFEHGPSEPVELQWATYYDAADEAGLSRVYGGIHPSYDDLPGRIIGSAAGLEALDKALSMYGPGGEPGPGEPRSVPGLSPTGMTGLILFLLLFGIRARSLLSS